MKIAIIGRPNVGKSTLFNRLIGKKHALVHDLPGVTRDYREGQGSLADLSFSVFDTPGLDEEGNKDALVNRMQKQTERAVDNSDICLFVIDAIAGVTPLDRYYANWLRKKDIPVILIANKCEGKKGAENINEIYELGFNKIAAISAEHGLGMEDLYDKIILYCDKKKADKTAYYGDEDKNKDKETSIAIIGRPNSGKSTLLNKILGYERVLTGPEAGITRDSIGVSYCFNGNNIKFVDTAGMRKKANIREKLEKIAIIDSQRSINFAQIAVLVLDAKEGLNHQDIFIADLAIKEGRCLVLALNKWDMIDKKEQKQIFEDISYMVGKKLSVVPKLPIIPVSALTGYNIKNLITTCLSLKEPWSRHISTAKLNDWLNIAIERHPPPLAKNGRRIKLKYVTQGKTRPPTFYLFSNKPGELPDSYMRYLSSSLQQYFALEAVPIRLSLKKGTNPYSDK